MVSAWGFLDRLSGTVGGIDGISLAQGDCRARPSGEEASPASIAGGHRCSPSVAGHGRRLARAVRLARSRPRRRRAAVQRTASGPRAHQGRGGEARRPALNAVGPARSPNGSSRAADLRPARRLPDHARHRPRVPKALRTSSCARTLEPTGSPPNGASPAKDRHGGGAHSFSAGIGGSAPSPAARAVHHGDAELPGRRRTAGRRSRQHRWLRQRGRDAGRVPTPSGSGRAAAVDTVSDAERGATAA